MSYRVTYYDFRGRVEVIRCIFHAGKVDFVDDRMSFDEYEKRKVSGEFAANFGRIPVLDYNGTLIGQSKAIERFLSKKFGLFGSNEIEEVKVDMICEHCRDVKDRYAAVRDGKSGDELNKAKTDFVTNELPGWFAKIESSLEGVDGYAVGTSLSLADIYMFHFGYDYFDYNKEQVETLIQSYPKLKASADKAKAALSEYLAVRPVRPW